MKETFQIPTPETLEALTGKELYDLWNFTNLSNRNTIWNKCGIMEGKNGLTNTNIAEAEKLYVPYTPKNKRLGSWLF